MIKALLIDDEPLACELVEEYLRKYPQIEITGRCHDGFEAMKAIHEHHPDLIFLDVQMPKISGFELLELLEEPPAIIFTTAFDEYAINAFEANAIDYLLKPFSEERFHKAIEKFLKKNPFGEDSIRQLQKSTIASEKNQNRIVIKDGGKIRILPVRDIFHLKADGDYVKIYTSEGNFMKKQTLQHFEDTLSSDLFIRVHRSHLLNISHITRIDPYEKNSHLALLKNGDKVPVSRSGYHSLKKVLKI